MRRALVSAAALVVLAAVGTAIAGVVLRHSSSQHETAPREVHDDASALPIVFAARSYAPGSVGSLHVWRRVRRLTLQIFRLGPEPAAARRSDVMNGVPVTPPRRVAYAKQLEVRIGDWPTGFYFARATAPGRVGYAPFVLRPARLGENRVAVVLPTFTWQAYNFRDVDGDGVGDTWYADSHRDTVDLERPFLDHGVPPHFRGYDVAFLRWLVHTGRRVDYLADDDLERIRSGDELAKLYDLVVFAGHHEYKTTHEYDVVERYRDRGGNLAFLSSNDFFYRVELRGNTIRRTGRWRDVGRPEARLIGVQYLDWNHAEYKNAPYVVVGARKAPWLFRGTGLRDGSRFGVYGIEIDARTHDSPPGTTVLADVPDVFGHGKTAEMTYYRTRAGAKVFAAGTTNFGGSAASPIVARLLDNLWARLSRP